jgi:hypothetical protein
MQHYRVSTVKRFMALKLSNAILLFIFLLTSCNRNPDTTTEIPPSPSPSPSETATETPETPADGTLGKTCSNKQIGYTISYPADWETNSGNVVEACQVFDPDVPQLPENSETFDEAVFIRLAQAPFEQITAKGIGQTELLRQKASLKKDTALVIEAESTGQGLLPKGIRSYSYFIEMGNETLIAETFDVEGQDYQRNKAILDQMMQTLELNE